MDPRVYELATLAAATALKSSYCSLAHGKALTGFYEEETIAVLAKDRAILPSPEAGLMDFSAKVATETRLELLNTHLGIGVEAAVDGVAEGNLAGVVV